MAKRKKRKNGSISTAAVLGRLSTQPVIISVQKGTTKKTSSSNRGRGSANSLGRTRTTPTSPTPVSQRTGPRPSITAVFSNSNSRGTPTLSLKKLTTRSPLTFTAAGQRLPIRLANRVPLFKFQDPLLLGKPIDKFSEDVLDVSSNEIVNARFVAVEKNGISSFRPEILQITDFLPIWKGRPMDQTTRELTPAGKLIDVQYNSLWLRRDTLIGLFDGLSKENKEGTKAVLEDLKTIWLGELERTDRTIKWFADFLGKMEVIKNLLDLKGIPRSSFDHNHLPLDDFFDSRMQFSKDKLETFSDTKIILQLLADFRQITESYSTNLLDLIDPDRTNDYSPTNIDTTYTLNNGFTFTIDQIRSRDKVLNASSIDFFNAFLNSLPNETDSKLKLLLSLLSKEYRVSKNLGIPQVQEKLLDNFGAGSSGSPFDNIIGIPGATIFDQPLGSVSLSSLFVKPLDNNAVMLPLEKKYVDAQDIKKTFIPGSAFLVDTLLKIQGSEFNTQPFVDYSNEVSTRFSQASSLIRELYDVKNVDALNPDRLTDMAYSSFRSSIFGMRNISNINKDQAITVAIFRLADRDNELKNKLFQFCLLTGLASNVEGDEKPIFVELANEIGSIHNLSAVAAPRSSNPNLKNGLRALRPFIEQLAADIENRVLSLTTPTPKYNMGLVLRSNPDYTRFRTTRSPRDRSLSAFTRLSIAPLTANQTTINIPRFSIRRILMSNVDPKSTNSTNLIKEFVDLSNSIAQSAALNGTSAYLLDDQTGRTRFNFLSTSTQLLLIFELVSGMSSKYSFSDFGRSRSIFNTFITIDVQKNDFVIRTLNEIISSKTNIASAGSLSSSPGNSGRSSSSPIALNSNSKIAVTTFSKMLQPSKGSIARSGNSTGGGGKPNLAAGTLSLVTGDEADLLHAKLGSGFLGSQLLGKVGYLKFGALNFTRETVNIRSALLAIKNKAKTEDVIIGNILHILSVVERRIRDGKNKIINFFNKQILEEFLKENDASSLSIIRNPSQVRAAAFIQREARNRVKVFASNGNPESISNFLVDPDVVFPETRNALYSLLTEPEYLQGMNADLRTKIITIGIPAGFSQQLTSRIEHAEINKSSFLDKQFDVIAIKIYKRDQRFDEIIFKPKTFLFDLSLFQEEMLSVQARSGEKYSRIVERNQVLDLEALDPAVPTFRSIGSITKDQKYSFLTKEQKTELIHNHTTSAMHKLYLQMLTGMKISEATFVPGAIEPGSSANEKLTNLIYTYLRDTLNKNIPNQSIQQLLKDPNVDDEAKDILRLITYGNLVFDPVYHRSKVINSKVFDRVFHISFNTEDFEVDEDATRETETGRIALEKPAIQERLIQREGKTLFVPKTRNELVFEDYFTVIENSI